VYFVSGVGSWVNILVIELLGPGFVSYFLLFCSIAGVETIRSRHGYRLLPHVELHIRLKVLGTDGVASISGAPVINTTPNNKRLERTRR